MTRNGHDTRGKLDLELGPIFEHIVISLAPTFKRSRTHLFLSLSTTFLTLLSPGLLSMVISDQNVNSCVSHPIDLFGAKWDVVKSRDHFQQTSFYVRESPTEYNISDHYLWLPSNIKLSPYISNHPKRERERKKKNLSVITPVNSMICKCNK